MRSSSRMTFSANCFEECFHLLDFASSILVNVGVRPKFWHSLRNSIAPSQLSCLVLSCSSRLNKFSWLCYGYDLCDADYVGYTRRHLFQRIDEHKHSAIGKHLRDSHNQKNKDLTEQFTILKKCRGKFECLIYEMLFIQEKKPKLNTQSDSIKAKLFST